MMTKPAGRQARTQGGRTSTFPSDGVDRGMTGMVTCWPGVLATVDLIGVGPQSRPDDAHLVLMMDPFNLMLTASPQAHGVLTMARFLRELAQAAMRMADRIDPTQAAPVFDYSAGSGDAP